MCVSERRKFDGSAWNWCYFPPILTDAISEDLQDKKIPMGDKGLMGVSFIFSASSLLDMDFFAGVNWSYGGRNDGDG